MTHATVTARWPGVLADGVVDPSVTPPGGESIEQLGQRVVNFLDMVAERPDHRNAYFVTHNGWIRMALLLNGDITVERLFAGPVPFLRPIAFQPRPDQLEQSHVATQ